MSATARQSLRRISAQANAARFVTAPTRSMGFGLNAIALALLGLNAFVVSCAL